MNKSIFAIIIISLVFVSCSKNIKSTLHMPDSQKDSESDSYSKMAVAEEYAAKERKRIEAEEAAERKRLEAEKVAKQKRLEDEKAVAMAKLPYILVDEQVYIQCQEGQYWAFTVPKYYNYIEIDCSTNIGFDWETITFAIVPTEHDANSFCFKRNYNYIPGTMSKEQHYTMKFDYGSLKSGNGQRYFLCAFNNEKGFLSAKQYSMHVKITVR